MQNIQFGVARGGRLAEPVAEHIGGYVRASIMDRCHTK
jgi:hypothetical protein